MTLKSRVIKKWAYRLKTCIGIIQDLQQMRKSIPEKHQLVHKEKGQSRIKTDSHDPCNRQKKLEKLIHPLRRNQHGNEAVDIASCKIERDSSVNVTDRVDIEKEKMKEVYETFPDGFYSQIKKKAEKTCSIGDIEIYSTEAIYTCITCLVSASSIKIKDVLKYKLSPVPTSFFDENGDLRLIKKKSELKNTLKTEVSNRCIITEALVVDGNAVLWALHWSLEGTNEDLAEIYFNYVMVNLTEHDVYFVFDRYYDFSIK